MMSTVNSTAAASQRRREALWIGLYLRFTMQLSSWPADRPLMG